MKFVLDYEYPNKTTGVVEIIIPDTNLPPNLFTLKMKKFVETLDTINAHLDSEKAKVKRSIQK